MEGAGSDPQVPGCRGLVPSVLLQRVPNRAALQLRQAQIPKVSRFPWDDPRFQRRQVGQLQGPRGTHDTRAVNDVSQFTDIAWPAVLQQSVDNRRCNSLDIRYAFVPVLLSKEFNERWDVLDTFSQWREMHRQDIDSVEEIRTETIAINVPLQIAVCSGQDANVDVLSLVATKSLKFPLFQDSQELGLHAA